MNALYKAVVLTVVFLSLSLGTTLGTELPSSPMVVNGIPVPAKRPDQQVSEQEPLQRALLEGRTTSQPIGHEGFCDRNSDECGATYVAPPIRYSSWLLAELESVGSYVNHTIFPQSDRNNPENPKGKSEWWKYPNRFGDCEDYVLQKRLLLHQRFGFPLSVLLITVVEQPNGEGHAVLTVVTDRGNLILDNLNDRVVWWDETPYKFLKRVSRAHAGKWVELIPPPTLASN